MQLKEKSEVQKEKQKERGGSEREIKKLKGTN